jgi:hypothetical protein
MGGDDDGDPGIDYTNSGVDLRNKVRREEPEPPENVKPGPAKNPGVAYKPTPTTDDNKSKTKDGPTPSRN